MDTLILARDKFPGAPVSLDALCKRFRIDNSKRTQHTALIDCDLLAKVYINLIDQKEPTLDFINNTEEKKHTESSKVVYFKGIVKPSDQELKKHKGYLYALAEGLPKLVSSMIKFFFYCIIFKKFKSKVYYNRALGLINSMLNRSSWYRPKID